MTEYTIIDADTHITEPPDVWVGRVPAKYRDRVPHVVRDESGKDIWLLEGRFLSAVGTTAPAGWAEPFPGGPKTYEECHPAAYLAPARLEQMDSLGIWAQVLYPNIGGFGSQTFLRIDEEELKLATVRAYNDWLLEWCSEDARRLLGIAATPFWDPIASAAEIERVAALGLRGVLMTGEPQSFGMPHLGDPHWDPYWRAAEECGLAVHFHIGSGDMMNSFSKARIAAHGFRSAYAYSSVDMFMRNGVQVADLLLSGVLERFPALRFVSVESGIGWIPFVLESADYAYAEVDTAGPRGDLKPSELFARQVYSCYWFEQIAPKHLLDEIPVDRIMFETDFPHPTCLYGDVHETIERGLGGATPEQRRKILWDNASALYNVEMPTAVDVAAGQAR